MRGDIAFEPALRERVALLEGLSVSVIEEVLRDRIKLTPGARTLIATMRANGARTCMVSGGFTHFTDRIAAMIGFDENRANSLTVVDGRKLAGRVAEPIFGRDGKRAALDRAAHRARPRQGRHHGDRRRRQRSRHDPGGRAWASPTTPSRRSRRKRPRASTTAISPRSCMCRATGARSSCRPKRKWPGRTRPFQIALAGLLTATPPRRSSGRRRASPPAASPSSCRTS